MWEARSGGFSRGARLTNAVLLALVGTGFLATLVSLQRQKAIEQRRRHEAVIHFVESLRQPLTIIIGYTYLLRSQPGVPDPVKGPLSKIGDAARSVSRQVTDLLADNAASYD